MQSYHHRPIKRFELDGSIYDDAHIDRLKSEYLALLVIDMKMKGYVPRYEIDPDFTVEFIPGRGYEFRMSIYGTYVGKRKAQYIDGLDGYRARYAAGVQHKELSQEEV